MTKSDFISLVSDFFQEEELYRDFKNFIIKEGHSEVDVRVIFKFDAEEWADKTA